VWEQERSLQSLYILYLTLATGLFLLWRGGQRVKIPTLGVRLVAYLAKKHTHTPKLFSSGGENGAAHTYTHCSLQVSLDSFNFALAPAQSLVIRRILEDGGGVESRKGPAEK
jgi:hypothetical protein